MLFFFQAIFFCQFFFSAHQFSLSLVCCPDRFIKFHNHKIKITIRKFVAALLINICKHKLKTQDSQFLCGKNIHYLYVLRNKLNTTLSEHYHCLCVESSSSSSSKKKHQQLLRNIIYEFECKRPLSISAHINSLDSHQTKPNQTQTKDSISFSQHRCNTFSVNIHDWNSAHSAILFECCGYSR